MNCIGHRGVRGGAQDGAGGHLRHQDEGDRAEGDLRGYRPAAAQVRSQERGVYLQYLELLPREECSTEEKEQCRFEPREVVLQKCDPTVKEVCQDKMRPVCTEKCENI